MLLIPPVQAALWLGVQQVAARCGREGSAPVPRWVGAGIVAAAAAFGATAVVIFIREGTTWHPGHPEEASALVTNGPHAWTRHPMYLAMTAGLVGTGLLSPRPWTALAALGLPLTLAHQVRREETALAAAFGEQWNRYAERVPRWIGRRGR